MEASLLFASSLAIFLVLFSGGEAAKFTFKNNCQFTIWPGTLTGAGLPQLSSTGFELKYGESSSLDAPATWSGRFWARTHCAMDKSSKFVCATGDCASGQVSCNGAGGIPPATLTELTIGTSTGVDFYDISLVDGYNLPVSLQPLGGASGCSSTSCPNDVNPACPPDLQVKGSDGEVVACKSACMAYNMPQYCCTGAFGSPATCPATEFSKIFKTHCPQAYSYAYDDKTSTFKCGGGPNYLLNIRFHIFGIWHCLYLTTNIMTN